MIVKKQKNFTAEEVKQLLRDVEECLQKVNSCV